MGYHEIILDRQLRNWVFLPLTLSILLMRVLQQYAMKVLSVDAPADAAGMGTAEKKRAAVRETQVCQRSARTRALGGYLPKRAVLQRKAYFVAENSGVLQGKAETKPAGLMAAQDPKMVSGQLKRQMVHMAPQFGMGALVNWLFSGFVVGRVPFTLSPKFRPMLQRGIDLQALDVGYFTSLSLYIVLLFGMGGVLSLVYKEETIDQTAMMRQPMGMGMGGPMGFDAEKQFNAEKQAWEVYEHKYKCEGAEKAACAALTTLLKQPAPVLAATSS